MNKPEPPKSRIVCEVCGELKAPDYKHNSIMCRFVKWIESLGK